MTFEELGFIEPINKALKDMGYVEPTDIQHQAIPLVLQRKDVLGCAQTGTGKTAAFALPIIQMIHQKEIATKRRTTLRALIVTPTRELALQIDENIEAYSKYMPLKHAVIFGGVKKPAQIRALKGGVHILTATPGRLLDLMSEGYISLDDIKLFVLDEADRMLDMGFIRDIEKILKALPKKKQSLFFSATMPPNIVKLSQQILYKPIKVEAARVSSAAETVRQYVYFTNRTSKKALLQHIIKESELSQVLLFARTKHGADRICRDLKKVGMKAMAIHGNKSQPQRQKALKSFKDGKTPILVATDIASRGIDIDDLSYVINYDIPNEPETYVHRIGRTGRAGKKGRAISICEPEENQYVKDIERLMGKSITRIDDHPYPQTDKPMTAAEKKEWNKEKQLRKQQYFESRRKSRGRRPARSK